jgi:hypothetical protein
MTWTDLDRFVTVHVMDRLRSVARVPNFGLHNNYGRYGRGENEDSLDTTQHETVKTMSKVVEESYHE